MSYKTGVKLAGASRDRDDNNLKRVNSRHTLCDNRLNLLSEDKDTLS